MDYNTWYDTYKPILNDDGSDLFETFGYELRQVRRANPACIWTLVDGDDGNCYIINGFHLVNRIAYLITELPFEGDFLEILDD